MNTHMYGKHKELEEEGRERQLIGKIEGRERGGRERGKR